MYDEARPEANNLLGIYEAMTGKTKEEVAKEVELQIAQRVRDLQSLDAGGM